MKKRILLFTLLLSPLFGFCQLNQAELTIGGPGADVAFSITVTRDKGYALTGYTGSYGYGATGNVYVIKLDSSGSIQWTKTVGGANFDDGYSITQTYDGGYAVGASTSSFGFTQSPFYVIKLDSLGNLKWTKTIGSNGSGASIIQTKDKGLAIAGIINYGDSLYGNAYLVKLDSAGNIQWGTSVGGVGHTDYFNSVVQMKDGGYAATGYTFSYGDTVYSPIYAARFDSAGNLKWTKVIGGMQGEDGISIIQASDGNIVITGST